MVGKGTKLQVRDDNHMKWGRYNSSNTPALPPGLADGNWLDSNDNRGIKWRIKGVGPFNAIGFFVIDAADVGGKFSIKVGKTLFSDLADGMRLKNGNIHFISILLPEAVDRLTIRLSHNIHNDGFGVDGAIVGQISRCRCRRRRRCSCRPWASSPASAGGPAAAPRRPDASRPAGGRSAGRGRAWRSAAFAASPAEAGPSPAESIFSPPVGVTLRVVGRKLACRVEKLPPGTGRGWYGLCDPGPYLFSTRCLCYHLPSTASGAAL